MKRRCFVAILAFVILPSAGYTQTRILIETHSETEGQKLVGIVEGCAAVALERAGFEAVAEGESAGAPFSGALVLDLGLSSGFYDLGLSLISAEGQSLASARIAGKLGLDFDSLLLDKLADLILVSGMTALASSAAAAQPYGPTVTPVALQPGMDGTVEPLTGIPRRPSGDAGSPPGPRPGIRLDVDSAPFIVVGKAADFFHYGYDAAASITRVFVVAPLRLEAGLRLGYTRVFPSGSVDGQVHLASLGLELRLSLPAAGSFAAYLRGGGGPLYLAAIVPSVGELGKLMPFCDAGLGFEIRPSARLSFGIELGIIAVFERTFPLVGLTPGIRCAWQPKEGKP